MNSGKMRKLENVSLQERATYLLKPTTELRIGIKQNLGSTCAIVTASLTYEGGCHPGAAEARFSLMGREPDVQPWLITLSALQ